ncbi:MAG: DUF4340 domain-containing protein, partial [Bacteroidota bacterium]|nr:DUF4340 domain-containing protein [Bacteroidota bacterium]MDX5429540.1 DUF4340 domain-containing protein [Bacteroidota bacterium]MDX5468327.1 DUF4340 domain-containing protein [Bacteroidota bacterium]
MSASKRKSILTKTAMVLSALLVIAVIFIPIIDKNFKSTLQPELKDFAVEDPDQVTEIFMASKLNTKSYVKLKRDGKDNWLVNDEIPAEGEKVKMLLYEYLARLQVKNPVPAAALDGVIKDLAANGIKVEVYKGNKKDKVFYVGSNAPDEMGTNMIMENSSRPFVVHIPGFMGYPAAIFNLNPKKWKSVNLFHTSIVELQSVQVFYPGDATGSFTVKKADKTLEIVPYTAQQDINQDALNVGFLKQYTATFENLTYESVYEGLAAKLADSVVRNSVPYAEITLIRTDGKQHKLKVYKKPVTADSPQMDNYGNPANYDLDRYYAVLDDNLNDVLSVQSFVFKNIFKRYPDFYSSS